MTVGNYETSYIRYNRVGKNDADCCDMARIKLLGNDNSYAVVNYISA